MGIVPETENLIIHIGVNVSQSASSRSVERTLLASAKIS
jgi:hypothetical protein